MPNYAPRVIVKFKNDQVAPQTDEAADRFLETLKGRSSWKELRAVFPGIEIQKLDLSPHTLKQLTRLVDQAIDSEPRYAEHAPNFLTYFAVTYSPPVNPHDVAAAFSALPWSTLVERAYVEARPSKKFPSGFLGVLMPNPLATRSDLGYLRAAPEGIDARFAWTIPGGDGAAGALQFADVESNWDFGHPALPSLQPSPPNPIYGVLNNRTTGGLPPIDHGTGALGIVVARDNTFFPRLFGPMSIGITPEVINTWVASYWTGDSTWNLAGAISEALLKVSQGDVVLLEMQWDLQLDAQTVWQLPAEYDHLSYEAIKAGTVAGKVVVEAAGNAGINLDTDPQARGIYIPQLVRGSGYDSGAIIVSAAHSELPHKPWMAVDSKGQPAGRTHNFGGRIDCFAWGDNIHTITSRQNASRSQLFSGTSGASAIVAGAALSIQGMNKVIKGAPLPAYDMRNYLSDKTLNTPSYDPINDKIGVMPNLKAIAQKLGFVDVPPAPPINLVVK